KIVIRGDRNVGKTALFTRLKGEPFKEAYIPSTEIQVASVHWNCEYTNEVIKVEVWDVVDKGKPRPVLNSLKLSNTELQARSRRLCKTQSEPCLDAMFLNVYKGAHGVLFVMDMTKSWTFDYVRRELPHVPPELPILVLANHRDMGDHRTITEDQVRQFLEDEAAGRLDSTEGHLPAGDGKGCAKKKNRVIRVQFCEASMRDGFGLLFVHKFFNLPFLCLQHAVLKQQLARNELQTAQCVLDLETEHGPFATNPAAYDAYLAVRRQKVSTHCGAQHPTTTYQTTMPSDHGSISSSTSPASNIMTVSSVHHSRDLPDITDNIQQKTKLQHTNSIGSGDFRTDRDACKIVNVYASSDDAVSVSPGQQAPIKKPVVLAFQEEIDPVDVIQATQPAELRSLSDSFYSESDMEREVLADGGDYSKVESPPPERFDSRNGTQFCVTDSDHLCTEYPATNGQFRPAGSLSNYRLPRPNATDLQVDSGFVHILDDTELKTDNHPSWLSGKTMATDSINEAPRSSPSANHDHVISDCSVMQDIAESLVTSEEDAYALEQFLSDS
ncbi:putative GTP-binding protein Parf, partial [Paragonimus heterotremus]